MSRQSRFLLQKRALFQQSAVFDRNLHNLRLDRAAKLSNTKEYDYLRNHAAAGMFERLKDVRRDFPQVLDLGANAGALLSEIPNNPKLETIEHFCQVAPVPSILQRETLPVPSKMFCSFPRYLLFYADVNKKFDTGMFIFSFLISQN